MAKRLQKTTTLQYEELLNFVEAHKDIMLCSKIIVANPNKKMKLWQTFAAQANAKCLGPPKTTTQWRKVFDKWKETARRRKINLHLQHRLLALLSSQEKLAVDPRNKYKKEQSTTVEDDENSQQLEELPEIKPVIPELESDCFEETDDSEEPITEKTDFEEPITEQTDFEEPITEQIDFEEQIDHLYTLKSENSLNNGFPSAEAVNNLAAAINNLADAKRQETEALHLLAKAKLLSAKTKYYEVFHKTNDLDV